MLCANELYRLLLASYGKPRWWSDDPFTVMFQAVLVQNTAWGSVEKTCAAIGDQLTPEAIGNLPTAELEALIRPCGFYQAKARTIQALIQWFRQYDFDRRTAQKVPLPQLRGELLAIRGVGAETADVILVYALYRASFIIDTYTRRFLRRFGYSLCDDRAIRCFFETALPANAQVYGWYHWLILEHCISACKKRPTCDACPLQAACGKNL